MATKKASTKRPVEAPPSQPSEPAKKYADDDNSIDARMWRLEQDHIRMGARPKR